MTPTLPDHPADPSPLPPTQPPDAPGTRPRFDLVRMVCQVVMIQERLAEWRRARQVGVAGKKVEREKGDK
jgi:hypothetical protein